MSGGWKIIKTMGTKITKVTPLEGVAAETAGATKCLSAVRWGVTVNLLWAWILTIPVSGLLAAGVYYIVKQFV